MRNTCEASKYSALSELRTPTRSTARAAAVMWNPGLLPNINRQMAIMFDE